MAERLQPLNDGGDPKLSQLIDEVRRTQRPLRLRVDDMSISVIPDNTLAGTTRRPKRSEKYPTVASLAGAAGSLPHKQPWTKIRESAREERLAKYIDDAP